MISCRTPYSIPSKVTNSLTWLFTKSKRVIHPIIWISSWRVWSSRVCIMVSKLLANKGLQDYQRQNSCREKEIPREIKWNIEVQSFYSIKWKASRTKRRLNLHLLLTRDQQFPINAHNNFRKLKVLISQFLVAPLLERGCDLIPNIQLSVMGKQFQPYSGILVTKQHNYCMKGKN